MYSSLSTEDTPPALYYGGGARGTNRGSRGLRGLRVGPRGAVVRSRGRPGPRRPRPSDPGGADCSRSSNGASDSRSAAPRLLDKAIIIIKLI